MWYIKRCYAAPQPVERQCPDLWTHLRVLANAAIVRLIVGPLNRPGILQLFRWESDFRELAVDRVESELWIRGTSGMGSYGGHIYPMRVAVDPNALCVEVVGGPIAPVRLPWSRIALVRCGMFRMSDERQLVAELITKNLEHQETIIPWSEALTQQVPMNVGLRDDGFQVRLRTRLRNYFSGR